MSAETLELPKVESISKEVFFAESYGVPVDKIWVTSISQIQLTGIGSLKFKVERPDSGSAKGGYIMLYLDEISSSKAPVIRKYYSGLGDFEAEIASNDVDFTKNNYVLAYAPHYIDNVRVVATSAKIFFGIPMSLCQSVCVNSSHNTNSVTSVYKFDSNPLGFGHYNSWMIVRKGSEFGEGEQVGIAMFDRNGFSEGIKIVSLTNSLQRGQTYNVVTTIYSTVRPVAGYTFTVPM